MAPVTIIRAGSPRTGYFKMWDTTYTGNDGIEWTLHKIRWNKRGIGLQKTNNKKTKKGRVTETWRSTEACREPWQKTWEGRQENKRLVNLFEKYGKICEVWETWETKEQTTAVEKSVRFADNA